MVDSALAINRPSESWAKESKKEKLEWWLGTELNRRHKDFQSSALPTELPSRKECV
jgi:hypothetical protein